MLLAHAAPTFPVLLLLLNRRPKGRIRQAAAQRGPLQVFQVQGFEVGLQFGFEGVDVQGFGLHVVLLEVPTAGRLLPSIIDYWRDT